MRPSQPPVIPANAGTQNLRRGFAGKICRGISAAAQPSDLGPGIRRDDRLVDDATGVTP